MNPYLPQHYSGSEGGTFTLVRNKVEEGTRIFKNSPVNLQKSLILPKFTYLPILQFFF